jgi:hypothetical protein
MDGVKTRIKVLKEPNRSPTSDKWMWVTLGGLPGQQSVLFEYDPSRAGVEPIRLLDGFTDGYLQTDGYAGYNGVCKKNNLTSLGCWDHSRRKFIEAQIAQPKGKQVKVTKADMALSYINKLYAIEKPIKSLSADEIYQTRQQKSVPLLNKLKKWLETNKPKVTKDSLTGKAMTYLHNQWEKLIVYCTDGRLRISNILAENAIRPFAIGRKYVQFPVMLSSHHEAPWAVRFVIMIVHIIRCFPKKPKCLLMVHSIRLKIDHQRVVALRVLSFSFLNWPPYIDGWFQSSHGQAKAL